MLVALCRLCVRSTEAAASVASACPERAQVPSTLCSPPEPARARERPSFDFPPLTEAAAAPAAHLSVDTTAHRLLRRARGGPCVTPARECNARAGDALTRAGSALLSTGRQPLTEAAAAPAAHLCPFRTPRLTACCAAPAGPPSRRRFTGSSAPSSGPSAAPSGMPSSMPSTLPSGAPSAEPSAAPSTAPSAVPSASLIILPSAGPLAAPSGLPSSMPSTLPSDAPSGEPSAAPSTAPSGAPSASPSSVPSAGPSAAPSGVPSSVPSTAPSGAPSAAPSGAPSALPSTKPSAAPSAAPSASPSSGSTLLPRHFTGERCVDRATFLTDRFRLSHSGVADAAHATPGAAGGLEAGTSFTCTSRRSVVLGEELSVHSSALERHRQKLLVH